MKRPALLATGAVAVLLLAAYALSPFLAIRELRTAANSGDRARLETLVDFPAVRDSLKSQISAKLLQAMHDDPDLKGNPLAALGALVAPAITDRVIDSVVTPDGLVSIIAQGKVARAESRSVSGSSPPPAHMQASYGYEGLNRFEVHLRRTDDPAVSVGLGLSRRGFVGWQLTRIDISSLLSADPDLGKLLR